MASDIFFESATRHHKNKLPFVLYRKPNKTKLKGILQQDDTIYTVNDFNESGFVFSPFDDRADSILLPLHISELIEGSYAASTLKSFQNKFLEVGNEDKAFHINLVKKGIQYIESGALQKVVLSRKEDVVLKKTDPISIFQNLLATYPSAFVYLWYHPKVGLWLGATPETLLKVEGRNFSIMSLAGTQNYKGTTDVVWQPKELQEQQFVTDFILENIKGTVDNVQVSGVETAKAGNLLHLRTQIWGVLNPEKLNFENLLTGLHPTPAVCGLPKDAAKQFILKHENYKREYYTGFLGELNFVTNAKPRMGKRNIEHRAYAIKRKSTQLYVNLRCMQIQGDKACIYVGGGITKTSNPESEWEETVLKSMVIKKVL